MANNVAAENFYDVLNLRRDCSDKEIKAAFVELSKKFHPDVKSVKTDSEQTARFQKIAEAYQTLSKPKLRKEYDRNLLATQSSRAYEATTSVKSEFHRPWEIKPDFNPNPGPYYGIKGLNRTTNFKIALILVVIGIFGGVFGYASVKHSYSLNQKRLEDVSAKAAAHHQKIRSEAEKYSNEEQIRRFIDRISNRSD